MSLGRWIDDLALEQVDTDGDGSLETTLYPVTDLLGSVQPLTDENGAVVERITYDPDGTPHFWSADTTRPSVTHVAWTGDGTLPTGDTVTAQALEIGLSEPIDPASAANATATLTPDGGDPATLTLTLAADSRTAYLTGAAVAAGTQYTLDLDGLTDTSHNPIWPEDATITIADPSAYEVVDDTRAPQLLAVLDGPDALYLLFDEPVEPAAGYDLTTAVSIVRSGQPVYGATTRLTANLLQWQPADEAGGLIPGGTYTLTAAHLTDLAGNPATASATFTHLNTTDQMLLLVYQTPTGTQPEGASAYGLTTLFQGRTWHADLGMYYYRARWYLPEMATFLERDPLGYIDSGSAYQAFAFNGVNFVDARGREIDTRGDKKIDLTLELLEARSSLIKGTLDLYRGEGKPDLIFIREGEAILDQDGRSIVPQHFRAEPNPNFQHRWADIEPEMKSWKERHAKARQAKGDAWQGSETKDFVPPIFFAKSKNQGGNDSGKLLDPATIRLARAYVVIAQSKNRARSVEEAYYLIHELGHADHAARDPAEYFMMSSNDEIYADYDLEKEMWVNPIEHDKLSRDTQIPAVRGHPDSRLDPRGCPVAWVRGMGYHLLSVSGGSCPPRGAARPRTSRFLFMVMVSALPLRAGARGPAAGSSSRRSGPRGSGAAAGPGWPWPGLRPRRASWANPGSPRWT